MKIGYLNPRTGRYKYVPIIGQTETHYQMCEKLSTGRKSYSDNCYQEDILKVKEYCNTIDSEGFNRPLLKFIAGKSNLKIRHIKTQTINLKTLSKMNANQIAELNQAITYNDGKIVWENGKGYTSETMKYLYKCGYRASTSGIMHYLYDAENNKVATSYSWVGLLAETARIMR